MKEFDKSIVTLIQHVAVALISAISSILIATLPNYLKNRKSNTHQCHIDKTEKMLLCTHIIFQKLSTYKNVIRYDMKFPDPGKDAVFKEILVKLISEFQKNFYDFANKLDGMGEDDIGKINLAYENTKMIQRSVEATMEMHKANKYDREESEVITIVFTKFNHWNSERFSRLETMIGQVSDSRYYKNKKVCQAVIFDLFIFAILDMLHDAEDTFHKVNGDLCGMKFKGIEIGH